MSSLVNGLSPSALPLIREGAQPGIYKQASAIVFSECAVPTPYTEKSDFIIVCGGLRDG
jgi:hypothetical protein